MARESPEERQRKRAREELAAALARNNAERAVNALLQLPPQEREGDLPAVARLFHAAVERDHRDGNWPRLDFWAGRAEREQRLLQGGTDALVAEVSWALLWSCLRSKQWKRAHQHLAALAGRLPDRLGSALDAFIAAEGARAPELCRDLVAAPALPDPRLGYDRGQRPAPPAMRPPARLAEVDEATLALASLCLSGDFAAAVARWADASPELAPAILTLAARLLRGEILSRMSKGGRALAPAQAVAGFSRRLGHPPELEAEVALALRVAAALGNRSTGLDCDDTRSFASVVRAAAVFPGLRPVALALALDTFFVVEARAVVLDLLEELCRSDDAKGLRLKALVTWGIHADPGQVPPRWIASAISDLLQRPGELAIELGRLPERTRKAALILGPEMLPLEEAERFWEQAWAWADDPTRPALLGGLDELLERARGRAGGGVPALPFGQLMAVARGMGFDPAVHDLDELEEILESPAGRRAMRKVESAMSQSSGEPLPPPARLIWDRFAEQVVPFRVSYLELALEQGGRKPERARFVKTFLNEKASDARAILDAIRSAEREGCGLASKALLDHLLGCLEDDRERLAQALLDAGRLRLRRGIRNPLARLFEAADARAQAGGGPDSPALRSARLELRLLGGRARAKPAGPRQRKRQRPRSQGGEQSPIPFPGRQS